MENHHHPATRTAAGTAAGTGTGTDESAMAELLDLDAEVLH